MTHVSRERLVLSSSMQSGDLAWHEPERWGLPSLFMVYAEAEVTRVLWLRERWPLPASFNTCVARHFPSASDRFMARLRQCYDRAFSQDEAQALQIHLTQNFPKVGLIDVFSPTWIHIYETIRDNICSDMDVRVMERRESESLPFDFTTLVFRQAEWPEDLFLGSVAEASQGPAFPWLWDDEPYSLPHFLA